MVEGRSAASAAIGEGHRHPVVAASVGPPARGARGAGHRSGDHESVSALVGLDAERAEAGDERSNAIALLDAEFARAAHGHLTAVRRERRDGRQLVDQTRHLFRCDVE